MTEVGLRLSDAARSVWAKSLDEAGRWLPLWQHMDDAADVAGRLFETWLAPNVVRLLANEFGGNEDAGQCAVRFLAGVHDLGKATPAFSVQETVLAQRMRDGGLYMPPTKAEVVDRYLVPHALAGHHLLIRWLAAKGWERSVARTWGVVLGGHHGVPPDSNSEQEARPPLVPHLYGTDRWEIVQDELVERVAYRSGARDYLDEWRGVRLSQAFQVLATGIVIVADWIASNVDFFPYLEGDLPELSDATDRTHRALQLLGLPSPWQVRPPPAELDDFMRSRFSLPEGAEPRPIQHLVADLVRDTSDPGLLIVEAPMGEGKTEAALTAAEILAQQFNAGGLFIALPTQATTDAMFERVVDWLDHMGSGDQEVGGSIVLTHGKARFNPIFAGLKRAGRLREIETDGPRSRNGRPRGEAPHAVVAHAWLTGRKKAQLANFTVGTIDQLLFAGLKSRHLMLRHLGLVGKVVVLDEIHAYDAFINSYLTKVLTWLGYYRVPVIALSATLPGDLRVELIEAYRAGCSLETGPTAIGEHDQLGANIGYPVVTWAGSSGAQSQVAKASTRSTSVHLDVIGDDDEIVSMLLDRLRAGGNALVVRNTVRRVLEIAQVLEGVFPDEVTVAHSRFIAADRTLNDKSLLKRFGPPRSGVTRPTRHIVVASQVVEQSLDVDFDLLVTDLAPVDLVLQRMGRLHRHQRGTDQIDRPPGVRQAHAYVTGVDLSQIPPNLDGVGAGAVYDRYVLLRSAAALLPHMGKTVELPADIAPLVQVAYGPEEIGPPDWQDAMHETAEVSRVRTARRTDKARVFQIVEPGRSGKAIVGWVSAGVGDTDDQAQGQGQVRDGAPSLEAILVQTTPNGQWHTPHWLEAGQADLPIPSDAVPSDDVAEVMISCSIRLPLNFSNAESEEALWEGTPEAWEKSSAIYRYPVLIVDEGGWGEIAGSRIRYTPATGLEVVR